MPRNDLRPRLVVRPNRNQDNAASYNFAATIQLVFVSYERDAALPHFTPLNDGGTLE